MCFVLELEFGNPELEFGNPELEFGNPELEFGNPELEFGNPELVFGNPEGAGAFRPLKMTCIRRAFRPGYQTDSE